MSFECSASAPSHRPLPILALTVAAAMFMQNLDGAIINTSLPQMAGSFGATTVDMSLGITAYMLASAAVSPLANWLSDRFGTRNVLFGAVFTFTSASLWCALSHGLAMFVAARVAQGMGGALMMPVGTAMVMRHAQKSEIMRASAMIVWPALLAPIVGPVLGGFITQSLNWRWNFWLNLPVGLLGAVAVLRFVPRDHSDKPRPLDMIGFALSAVGLTCLLAGFQRSSIGGSEREIAAVLILIGMSTGLAALRHLRRHPTPLLSLAPLSHASMMYAILFPGALFRALFSIAPFLLPLLFQLGFGLSPAMAGGWVLVYFCGNLGIKPATTWILRRFGFRRVLLTDGWLVALSMLGFALVSPTTPKFLMIVLLLFAGCVRSMQLTSLGTIAFADVPGPERGAASNLQSMLQQAASAAGVAFGAFSLSLFQTLRGSSFVALPELHATFALTAIIAVIGTLAFHPMPPHLGREVSGHHG